MVYALPVVQTKEDSIMNPLSILSIILFLIVIYLFFGGMDSWPKFLKDLPEFAVYLGMVLIFINGIYTFLRPSLISPENIGCMELNDETREIIVTLHGRITEISFSEINRINFEIKGPKELMGNLNGNLNFVEITYNLYMSKIKCEFVIESTSQIHIIKNVFNKVWIDNPKVNISYLNPVN